MAKPERGSLAVRRPVDPAAAEAFLSGRPFAQAAPAAAPDVTQAPELGGRRVLERKDGRRVRRTTVLMVETLATRVDLYAARHGLDKTAIVQAALEQWLAEHDC